MNDSIKREQSKLACPAEHENPRTKCKVISTKKAPAAIGPYSQAIQVGNLVFTSGQIPIEPSTGAFVEGGIKEQTPEEYLAKLQQDYPYGFVLEELIRQCQEMAALHPESVNTVRIPTLRFDDHVQIVHPFLRVGRGKSVVDNGMSGGILCTIDPETGIVKNTADERGVHYVEIPESGAGA